MARPAVEIRSYLPAPLSARVSKPLDARLGRFDVAPAFEGKQLVWRLDETRYESDFYNELLTTPREMLMNRTAEWFGIKDGSAQLGLSEPSYLLEAYAPELYGDMRSRPGQAVLRMHYKLTASRPTPHVVFEREYAERVDLEAPRPEAFVKALGTAHERILTRLQADLPSP
ncbi:MAG TPA: hypothetical protein VJU83_03065 [Burkholderiales bacterium]|nr:hypothetical protein [Burkholderiales bacterium]